MARAVHTLSSASTQLLRGPSMQDLLFIGVTIVFFAIALTYVRACDRV
jgi:hypothetical protein